MKVHSLHTEKKPIFITVIVVKVIVSSVLLWLVLSTKYDFVLSK